jgi:hypothetical protein
MTFPEFDENNLPNQKNKNSASSLSGYVSFNSLFNSLLNLNSSLTLFSSVFSQHGSEQYLDPITIFPPLLKLSFIVTHPLKVDFSYTDKDFEELLFYFVYRSSSFPPSFPNITTDSSMTSKEFKAFYQLSFHVFSFLSSHYYSLY